MSVERAGAVAAAVGIAAVVIALLVVARQAAPRRQPVPQPQPVPAPSVPVPVPDSVFGYHGEPEGLVDEPPADWTLQLAEYCPGCRRRVYGIPLQDGRWLCWQLGHINEEESHV